MPLKETPFGTVTYLSALHFIIKPQIHNSRQIKTSF